jgi:hypothetical protein
LKLVLSALHGVMCLRRLWTRIEPFMSGCVEVRNATVEERSHEGATYGFSR